MTEPERGWGGPIAIGVALLVMWLFHLAMKRWGKIDNPSPAAGGEGGGRESWLVRWGFMPRGADPTEGDVDQEETLEDWLISSMGSMGWRDLINQAVAEFGVTPREAVDLVKELREDGY